MKKVLVCLLTLTLMSLSAWAGTWTSGSTTITTSGSTLTVSGNGAMADYSYSGTRSWISNSITEIVIEEGVTHIGAYAFIAASYVTRVDISTSVTSIGEGAFASCTKMDDVYYAGSPNEWASISFSNDVSNPFGDISGNNGKMHFYGCSNTSTTLTLEPGIKRINDYAFYKMKIANLNIPGSVEHIGRWAFKCMISGQVCVNRTIPPTTGFEAFSYNTTAKLYVPSGSQSTYQSAGKPWYRSTYGASDGASSVTGQAVSGTLSASYGAGVTWTLDQDGILTFDASSPSASKSITLAAGGDYPWGYFRRLVHKVRLRGEITALGNALAYHWFLSGLILDQNTVPTCSKYIASTDLTSAASYSSLYNSCNPLLMEVKLSSLLSPTQAAKLEETAPWNDGHWQIAIDDEVVVDENSADNLELFAAIQKYVDVPFTMRLERSVSNAYYNTFCSPIDLDAETVEATFGAGTLIHELASTSYDEEANELTLEFADSQNYMEAGVPYLFKPANSVSNPTFTDVDPTAVATAEGEVDAEHVTFYGTLEPKEVTSLQIDAKNFIFLLANNQLTWANGGTLKAMRAYWLLQDGVPSRALSRRPIMRIGQSAQGIEEVSGDWRQETGDGKQVTGRKVLRDGQLIIVHEGVEYNAQGIRL